MVRLLWLVLTTETQSGLIAYLKVLRNGGFKYLVCCSLPMVEATCVSNFHMFYANSLPNRAFTVQVANS